MDEFQESEVLWPEEDVRQRLAYGCGGRQQGRRRHCGPPAGGTSHVGGAGANARESSSSAAAPVAVPSSAPASRRHRQSWATAEFSRRDEDEEGDVEMVPPHVLVARRLSGKTAFSMCTGQGRTLKGRDLSQVRNSVLRLTGFLEG